VSESIIPQTSSGDDPSRNLAVAAIRIFRAGGLPEMNGCTAHDFGRYWPVVEGMRNAWHEAHTNGATDLQGLQAVMQEYLTALAADPTFRDLSNAVGGYDTLDALDERNAPEEGDDQKASGAPQERVSQATLLVRLAAGVELFHSPDQEAFASMEVAEHHETWLVNSKGCRDWLRQRFFAEYGKTPGTQALQDAIGVLEGQAVFRGQQHDVALRLAEHQGALYLDLANEHWQAIRITADGWTIEDDLPVKFRRTRGMLPLPSPIQGGSIEDLQAFVNVSVDDESEWILLLSWLFSTFHPSGPYPVLVLHGEQGSAKSTTSRVLRALIDPNTTPLRAEPRDAHDLLIAASNAWVVNLDNLSHVSPWLSDAICRLSTGGGFATRQLYTDRDEILFDAKRPVILNGIEELATRGDLLDRAIILYLPEIPKSERKRESVFWQQFEQVRPGLLGVLLSAVSAALANVDRVELDELPRMADFAVWGAAAAPALGWQAEAFLDSYSGNRDAANELTLEASAIAPFISHKADMEFHGTATQLLQDLNILAAEHMKRQKSWPRNERSLSNALRRIARNLRAIGIDIEFSRKAGGSRERTITVMRRKG